MMRTQIYLTEAEKEALSALAAASGKSQSELIREAIDSLLANSAQASRDSVLDRVAGIWRDRDDLPDWGEVRQSWERQAS